MRTFIALEMPETLRLSLGELSRKLSPGLKSMKWVRPENIHLTLRFLGEIAPERLEAVNNVIAGAAGGIPPFGLKVSEIGHFGPPRNPRVLWLGLAAERLLEQLAAGIESRLAAAGFGPADKPFRAHLTLARAGNHPGPPPDWDWIAAMSPAAWPLWPVREVCLIKSTLTPQGPIYEILSRHALQG